MKQIIKKLLNRIGYTLISNRYACEVEDPWLVLKKLPLKNPVRSVFDVGANIGALTRELAFNFPSAEVFAFEPIAETFETLVRSTASLPRVQSFDLAFGSVEKSEVVWLQKKCQWNSLTPTINCPPEGAVASEVIRMTTIDAFCNREGIRQIDILKTDTEGFDLEVLRGAGIMLAEHRITCILSEVGFTHTDTRHTLFFELNDMLKGKGYGFHGLFNMSAYCQRDSVYYADALFVHPEALRR